MITTKTIYKWCLKRYEYYQITENKNIYELWDDVRIMLARNDFVKGNLNSFASFMFGQCKKHEIPVFIVSVKELTGVFCADSKYIYHPVMGPIISTEVTVLEYSKNGDTWKGL